eukprot:CAMPEP_0174252972 /NCGR_PEP_ID=MMETSP0439-20130205/2343_1 /TAXON_ID=0 /ORGANISM="Stereomyxa ramosa, Strain Chinc5" /LENGTH=140 /DNA_ID=CAMNT_0015333737 /DNA_START=111 /DNA_END=533 /DNA_ORIENTATION=+
MSWDSYIDNIIAQSKDASGTAHIDKACIIGIEGGAGWTTQGHASAYKLSGTETGAIAKCFKGRDFNAFMSGGILCEGVKYTFLREIDGKVVMGRKAGSGAVTLQASKTAIIIAHTPEGGQQGNANKAVGVIADYLESMNM